MPQQIISQFSRQYGMPIETNIQFQTINQRDAIPDGVRWEGMIVYVITEGKSYQLVGGIDNSLWQEFNGIQDAPIDNQTYVRRNGQWVFLSGQMTVIVTDRFTYTAPNNTFTLSENVGEIIDVQIEQGCNYDSYATLANQKELTISTAVLFGGEKVKVIYSL